MASLGSITYAAEPSGLIAPVAPVAAPTPARPLIAPARASRSCVSISCTKRGIVVTVASTVPDLTLRMFHLPSPAAQRCWPVAASSPTIVSLPTITTPPVTCTSPLASATFQTWLPVATSSAVIPSPPANSTAVCDEVPFSSSSVSSLSASDPGAGFSHSTVPSAGSNAATYSCSPPWLSPAVGASTRYCPSTTVLPPALPVTRMGQE